MIRVQVVVADGDRSQPHDGAIAAGAFGTVTGSVWILSLREAGEGRSRSDADVKAFPVDRIPACLPPCHVATGLIMQIPADTAETVCQCEGHTGVVRPLTSRESMGATGSVVGNGAEAAG